MNPRRSMAGIVVVLLVLLGVWQGYIWISHTPSYVLPTPGKTAQAIRDNFSLLVHRSWTTVEGAAIGLAVAVVLAIILAVLIVRWPMMEHVVLTYALLVRTLPIVGVAPIITLVAGRGLTTSVLCVMVVTVFSLLIALIQGFESIPAVVRELADVYTVALPSPGPGHPAARSGGLVTPGAAGGRPPRRARVAAGRMARRLPRARVAHGHRPGRPGDRAAHGVRRHSPWCSVCSPSPWSSRWGRPPVIGATGSTNWRAKRRERSTAKRTSNERRVRSMNLETVPAGAGDRARDDFYAGGTWVTSDSTERQVVIDPATEQPIGEVPAGSAGDVERAVAAARPRLRRLGGAVAPGAGRRPGRSGRAH